MSWFDVSLAFIIGSFTLFGFWFGFVHTAGSLLGTLAGAFVASRYYELAAQWLQTITGWEGNRTRVIMFVLILFAVSRVIGFLFFIVDKILSIITRLPFISSLNRVLGSALGFLEGVMTIGLFLFFVERFPISERFMIMIAESELAPKLREVSAVFIPLLPDALKLLQSTIDYVNHKFI